MRAATKLFRKDAFRSGDRKYPYLLAILFAKQGHRARTHGLFNSHLVGLHGLVAQDVVINQAFDLSDLLTRQGLIVREVKTQIVWRHDRASLLDVRAENFA